MSPEYDGITHINVYSKGKTLLGVQLSNWFDFQFTFQERTYRNVENLWGYLVTQDERFGDLPAYEAKKLMSNLPRNFMLEEHRFKDVIIGAVLLKIRKLDLDIKTGLPFTHYYVYNNKSILAKEGQFIIDHLNDIRRG